MLVSKKSINGVTTDYHCLQNKACPFTWGLGPHVPLLIPSSSSSLHPVPCTFLRLFPDAKLLTQALCGCVPYITSLTLTLWYFVHWLRSHCFLDMLPGLTRSEPLSVLIAHIAQISPAHPQVLYYVSWLYSRLRAEGRS